MSEFVIKMLSFADLAPSDYVISRHIQVGNIFSAGTFETPGGRQSQELHGRSAPREDHSGKLLPGLKNIMTILKRRGRP